MMKESIATTAAVLGKPSLNRYASLGDLNSVTSSSRTAGRPYSPNAPSHDRKRNLSADFPLWHHNESWHPVGAWSSQKKRRYSSSTDSTDQGSRSPLWTPGLATAGRLKETQKKRRYSSSTDSTEQENQSPLWALDLATAGRLKETIFSASEYYERSSKEQEIGHIVKDVSTSALYFKVKLSAIPPGWSNDPDELSLDYLFSGVEANMRIPFQSQLGMSNPFPVVVDRKEGLWLSDSGDGKYYLWEAIADSIFEIYERNLPNILSKISENGGLAGTKFRTLGIVGCEGTPNYNAKWEVFEE